MITDNPLHDWANHVHAMDAKPIEYDHVCECCQKGFIKGSQFGDEKFCQECVDENAHIDFYEALKIDAKQIYEILSTEIKL